MKNNMHSTVSGLTILVSVFLSSVALAGFDITRMTTVVDDFNGSYTVTKSGNINDGEFSGTSLTEFNSFHPGLANNEATLSGIISRVVVRSEGTKSTTSDGELVLQSGEESLTVSFNGLSVSINQGEVILAGDVNVNDEVFDVNALPEKAAAILRWVFWMSRR